MALKRTMLGCPERAPGASRAGPAGQRIEAAAGQLPCIPAQLWLAQFPSEAPASGEDTAWRIWVGEKDAVVAPEGRALAQRAVGARAAAETAEA